jgi:hypothetical protein
MKRTEGGNLDGLYQGGYFDAGDHKIHAALSICSMQHTIYACKGEGSS